MSPQFRCAQCRITTVDMTPTIECPGCRMLLMPMPDERAKKIAEIELEALQSRLRLQQIELQLRSHRRSFERSLRHPIWAEERYKPEAFRSEITRRLLDECEPSGPVVMTDEECNGRQYESGDAFAVRFRETYADDRFYYDAVAGLM
jgi:hypothetical protein